MSIKCSLTTMCTSPSSHPLAGWGADMAWAFLHFTPCSLPEVPAERSLKLFSLFRSQTVRKKDGGAHLGEEQHVILCVLKMWYSSLVAHMKGTAAPGSSRASF